MGHEQNSPVTFVRAIKGFDIAIKKERTNKIHVE